MFFFPDRVPIEKVFSANKKIVLKGKFFEMRKIQLFNFKWIFNFL